ncbi:MAG TPA: DnaB-like helicase C-terminal domain-containing protein, partial [Terriglobales bacterium]|nr:DnaB-like helicase C-terminal domain-containing protein [Terriglobales bacterium]
EELLQRIWAQVADVPADAIYRGTLTDEMKAKVRAAMKQVGEWPIYIDDSAGLTVTELSARARLMHKRHCTELIIVDYVQVVEARAKDERQKVTMVSSQLRRIAKEHCAVLTVSQMPRPAGHDPNRRPTKFDLKESGSLENDAKVVVMLYRPVDEHNHLPTGADEVLITKQRNGPVGYKPIALLPSLRFKDRWL